MNKIKVNPYRKKNGDVMLYINDYERRVSFGIIDRVYTTKMTQGKKIFGKDLMRKYRALNLQS